MKSAKSLAAALAVLFPLGAQAGIPAQTIYAFNNAVESGDKPAIIEAADTLIAAALEYPGDPQAISAAFEAGTYLCLSDACPRASAAAPLMSGADTADVTPALANLLVVYADWSSEQNKTTNKAMISALEAVAPEAPTYLTISAFDRFHMKKLEANDLNEVRKVAELAAGHLKPVWNVVPESWANMELSAIATTFARNQDTAVIDRLARLQVALYPYHLAAQTDRPELTNLYYQAYAWRYAIDAYFSKGNSKAKRAIKEASEYFDAESRQISEAYFSGRPPYTPLCSGGFKSAPAPSYPGKALRDGYVGAVIVGFNINEGELEDIRVLAAVPDRQFEDAALSAMAKAEWQFDAVQDDPNCKRSRSSRPAIQPFLFSRG